MESSRYSPEIDRQDLRSCNPMSPHLFRRRQFPDAARHFRRTVFSDHEGNVASQAVEQHAGIEFQRATGNRPIEHGDQFVAKLRRAFNRFLRIFRRAETNIGHPMFPLELLEHVVSADSVAAIERMEQAAVDPENPQALRIGNRRWRLRARLRHRGRYIRQAKPFASRCGFTACPRPSTRRSRTRKTVRGKRRFRPLASRVSKPAAATEGC